MKQLAACLSIAFAIALTACAPSQTSRSAGQVVDDATITTKVKSEIAQTQGIGEAASINVDTYQGVVSLAGFVDSKAQAQAAENAAERVPGVKDVKNNLEIKGKTQ
ncbi:MAG TPA: BON domain-containing protein [Burkholderiales bacterium]|nr:BON domain-containing protein [Burkholderiales bacterium]